MPLQVAPKQFVTERLGNFLGVNLRRDRLNLEDQDVARAINFDFHREVGTALSRNRFRRIESGLDVPIRKIRVGITQLFIVGGGTLYNETNASLQTGIADGPISILEAKPLADNPNVFFATPTAMLRTTDGLTAEPWGHSKPTTRPRLTFVNTPEVLAPGTYRAVYTHVRRSGIGIAHESNPSVASLPASLSSGSGTLLVTVYPSSQSTYDAIRIYRTANGGNTYLFAREIADTGVSQTVDISMPDSALGGAVSENNGIPPVTGIAVAHRNRVWLLDDTNVYYSQAFLPESFAELNFFVLGSTTNTLQAAVSYRDRLGVFGETGKWTILEQLSGVQAISGFSFLGANTADFLALQGLSDRGTQAPDAVVPTEMGVFFLSHGGVYLTDFQNLDQPVSLALEPLFYHETVNDIPALDWTRIAEANAAYRHNRYYLSYPTADPSYPFIMAVYSLETQRWYHFDLAATALHYDAHNDRLLRGYDGKIDILEDSRVVVQVIGGEEILPEGEGAFSATLQTPTRFLGDRMVRKQFRQCRIDAEVPVGQTLSVGVYVDDVLKTTLSITGDRTRQLIQLPGNLMGYHYYFEATYTGGLPCRIYQFTMSGIYLLPQ